MNARSSENNTTNKRQFPAKFFDGALGWRRGVWYRGGTRAPSFEDLDALPLLSSFLKRTRGLSFSVTIYCFKWLITPNQISVNSKWKLRSGSSSWKVALNLVQGERKFCGCQKWFGNIRTTLDLQIAFLMQCCSKWRIKYRILCFDNLENQMVYGEASKENMKQKLIVQK